MFKQKDVLKELEDYLLTEKCLCEPRSGVLKQSDALKGPRDLPFHHYAKIVSCEEPGETLKLKVALEGSMDLLLDF